MTVVESEKLILDMLFERLEQMPVPEGYKVEIVGGGNIHMSPQQDAHREIIRRVVRALEDRFGVGVRVLSDVRINFPGPQNGFAPDVARLADGPKKTAYAAAEVPVYLIADPYTRRCHVYKEPKDSDYTAELIVPFGNEIDLTGTSVDLRLRTADFPRD